MFLKSKKIEGFSEHQIEIAKKQILIRQVDLEDTKKLVAIEEAVYTGSAPWNQFAFVSEINQSRGNLYLSSNVDGQAIAFIGLSHRKRQQDLHITNIAVLPIWQNKGLGSYLIKFAGELAKENKLGTLSLEVRRSNYKARKLYEKIGFKKIQELLNYYDDDHEDAIEMEWCL
ncbi:ribosomal protein S18-alanine N-acetyltransferase [Oenococcus sp. UCMA 16435]|nr:ribosomal protein S18-alanine N-acetyltransferase [Oenococcus sp. UCMA 16435]MDI4583508.1 ribosomal-protein-alanine N-acetyltransferase [Oenococcus sp. UCMA 14587]MDN6967703.1 ribosomal-protein-alanine N-acetyltransferase [Oenococcus sp. UCMA 17063]